MEEKEKKKKTYSRNLLLWILVMVEEAIGLPMPELAGEPCDTGVIQYGEFWLAGDSEASLGMLSPVSVEMQVEGKNLTTSNAKKLQADTDNLNGRIFSGHTLTLWKIVS